MSSLLAARQNAGPHEDTVLDAYHLLACEGNKQLHPLPGDLLAVARN
jgi:hypothetical protein